MLVTNVLDLLVDLLVQACKVSRKVSPRETGVPARLWEAVVVVIGLHVIWLVWVLATEQSYLGTVANRHLGFVPWVDRVSHSVNIHIGIDHDWEDLGS